MSQSKLSHWWRVQIEVLQMSGNGYFMKIRMLKKIRAILQDEKRALIFLVGVGMGALLLSLIATAIALIFR